MSKIPDDKLRRQNTSVSRNVQSGFTYAADLNEIFYLESGQIRRKFCELRLNQQTGITPILLQQVEDGFIQNQIPFYEAATAPSIQKVSESKV